MIHMLFYFQNGMIALHAAASAGLLEIVTLLINSGCDINAADNVSYI